jgi:thiamine kinase-like enzyme
MLKRLLNVLEPRDFIKLTNKVLGKIHAKRFYKLVHKGEWEKAIKIGENLLVIFPRNIDYHRMVARCYQNINNHKCANDIITKCESLNFDLNQVIKILQERLGENSCESKYVRLDGFNNRGMIVHTSVDNEYLTKISQSKHSRMEKLFYLKVIDYFPTLKNVTPFLKDFFEIPNIELFLITTKKIDGEKPPINKNIISQAGHISKTVSSIKYSQVKEWFPIKVNKEGHPIIDLLWSFTSINEKSTNTKLINTIYKKMKTQNYSTTSLNSIKRVEKVILKNEMYENINPEIHFSIQHGDFFSWNLIKEKHTNNLYLIDWGLMRIGPTWCDMAGFLGEVKYPFELIKEDYLCNKEFSEQLDEVEKLFFIYTLIAVWFTKFSKEEFETSHDTYLNPAIETLEEMVIEMNSNNFNKKQHRFVNSDAAFY